MRTGPARRHAFALVAMKRDVNLKRLDLLAALIDLIEDVMSIERSVVIS